MGKPADQHINGKCEVRWGATPDGAQKALGQLICVAADCYGQDFGLHGEAALVDCLLAVECGASRGYMHGVERWTA